MALSAIGYVRFTFYGVLLLVNTIVLALSAHINHFQQFFYRADIFPLALSAITLVFLLTMIVMDINVNNAVTGRPLFELAWLFVFGMLWLAFNAFSTSRWRFISLGTCKTIPNDAKYAPYRTWCHELQALRILVWIEWVMFFCAFAYLLRWTITKRNSGRYNVWNTPFSRFSESPSNLTRFRETKNSEFLQWEKFPQSSPDSPNTQYTRSQQVRYSGHEQNNYSYYSETQHAQSMETPYAQSLQGQHPIEAPYLQHAHALHIPPSQAYFTHSPQAQHVPPSPAQSFLPRIS